MKKTTTQENKMPKTEAKTSRKRQLTGVVVSDKMKDTIVVKVSNYEKITKYQKFVLRSKKYKAHDKGNTVKIGDQVTIEECRPLSKDKRFTLIGLVNPTTK